MNNRGLGANSKWNAPSPFLIHTIKQWLIIRKRMCLDVYSNHFNRNKNSTYTLNDLLKGRDLEIVAASLLLLGKLKVESVELFRNEPVIAVSLLGEFKKINGRKVDEMAEFLEKNGDMTIDEIFEGIKKRMNKDRRNECE